jgi:hypothetical protein
VRNTVRQVARASIKKGTRLQMIQGPVEVYGLTGKRTVRHRIDVFGGALVLYGDFPVQEQAKSVSGNMSPPIELGKGRPYGDWDWNEKRIVRW